MSVLQNTGTPTLGVYRWSGTDTSAIEAFLGAHNALPRRASPVRRAASARRVDAIKREWLPDWMRRARS